MGQHGGRVVNGSGGGWLAVAVAVEGWVEGVCARARGHLEPQLCILRVHEMRQKRHPAGAISVQHEGRRDGHVDDGLVAILLGRECVDGFAWL